MTARVVRLIFRPPPMRDTGWLAYSARYARLWINHTWGDEIHLDVTIDRETMPAAKREALARAKVGEYSALCDRLLREGKINTVTTVEAPS